MTLRTRLAMFQSRNRETSIFNLSAETTGSQAVKPFQSRNRETSIFNQ